MSAPSDIRPRLVRLLDGERRVEDLYRIFQWLRFQTRGRAPAVKDVGDFSAHRDEREWGISSEQALDFCHMLLGANLKVNEESRDVEAVRKAVMASLRSLGPSESRQALQIPYKRASELLKSAFSKINGLDGKYVKVTAPLSDDESKVLGHYSRMISVRPAFTQDILYDQFIWCLEDKGVLFPAEKERAQSLSNFIALFAITQMHGAAVNDGGKRLAILALAPSEDKARIGINVEFPMLKYVAICSEIFKTNLPWPDSCSEQLLDAEAEPADLRLEIDSNGKLAPLL